MITPAGRAWVRALRLTTPDVGAVARSLLGVLAMAAVALASAPPSAAVWASGAAAIAGAIAMQDSPAGRVPLVILVSLQMGAAVFLGALTASYNVVFIVVVAVWCFTAGMQSALGSKAGLVAAASAALLVIAPPVAPSLTAVVLATLLTVAAGCVQAALIVGTAAIVLSRAGLLLAGWSRVSRWLVWVVVALTAVSLVLNLITPSAGERALWAPVLLLLLASSAVVAIKDSYRRFA